MPELPDRPDLDQLRRQARDLHRAAEAGAPDALDRIRAFSDQRTLSAAQLTVAREHGYLSWPALQAEVRRLRSLLPAAIPQPAGRQLTAGWLDPRYSFGGGAAIQTADGVLTPDVLTVGNESALLYASAVLEWQAPARTLLRRSRTERWPTFHDLIATDDQGATFTVTFGGGSIHPHRPGATPRRSDVSFWIKPAPSGQARWIELRADNGSSTRLVPSPRAAVRVTDVAAVSASTAAERKLEELAYFLLGLRHSVPGSDLSSQRAAALTRTAEIQQSGDLSAGSDLPAQLARLCDCLTDEHLADELPGRWQRFLDTANLADGPQWRLDLAAAVPALGDLRVQLDHLASGPNSWRLYLRAMPTWWGHSEDGHRKWELASVRAHDDLGGRYVANFGGSSTERDYEDLKLEFVPRIDPLARRLNVTFGTDDAEAAMDLHLASAAE
jgi:hypothetical protein